MFFTRAMFIISFLCYIKITKYILDNYYPDLEKIYQSIILYLVPILIKISHTVITKKLKSKSKIKMTEDAKQLYKKTTDISGFKKQVELKYNNDVKSLEKEYYITGSNLLIIAVQEKNTDLVKYLLENGYDVNLRDLNNGETALLRAIHFNQIEMIEILLKYKADLTISSRNMGLKPMELAVFRNKPKIVEILLNENILFNYNIYKSSVLSKYIEWGDIKIEIKRLLVAYKSKLLLILSF